MNLIIMLFSVAALTGAVLGVLYSLNVLFILCTVLALIGLLLLTASKLGFAMFQSNDETPFIYIRSKGKTYHTIRGCSELKGVNAVRVPFSYAYRNRMTACPVCANYFKDDQDTETTAGGLEQ